MEIKVSLEEKSLILVSLKKEIESLEREIESLKELVTVEKFATYICFKRQQVDSIRELLKRFG